jgi:hypothetical protein
VRFLTFLIFKTNTQFRCYLPSLPSQKLKALICSDSRLHIISVCPHCCSCSYFWAVRTNICINIWSKEILSSCSIWCISCQGTCTVFCDLFYRILISAIGFNVTHVYAKLWSSNSVLFCCHVCPNSEYMHILNLHIHKVMTSNRVWANAGLFHLHRCLSLHLVSCLTYISSDSMNVFLP